ncbi:sugar ABC transporter ATP-binding protein [Sinomonas sp. G460-2]|uniref:sugar ABC transporter ATP-binding protein n=1 Tax=Sinomonas sp. G460-2 TaxID=3393464 RepID=UPI0039EEAC77
MSGEGTFTGVEVRGVSKAFGAIRAVQDVCLSIRPGTVHALVGENGAGKSTLGKIIAGALQPDTGQVYIDGHAVHLRSPRDALLAGIAGMEQEISLVPDLTVQQNVFLGVEPQSLGFVRKRKLHADWEGLVAGSGFRLEGSAKARSLSLGERQQVEILRAVSRRASLIVMDEPTAALNEEEARALHTTIRSITRRGASVLIVTHFLKEVLALADTITVLREGRLVHTGPAHTQTEASLMRAMLGRELSSVFPHKTPVAPTQPSVLAGRGIVAPGVRNVSLHVRAGEIVGLAGLDGSGRTELGRALFGDLPITRGTVEVAGSPLRTASPRASLARGLSMIPASRADDGLFPVRPILENTSIGALSGLSRAGIIRRALEAERVTNLLTRLGAPTARARLAVSTLSGGNQQRVLFARAMMRETIALIANEPTRGVDIGAKAAIYDLIHSLASEGLGVLIISSEPEELIGLCHRVVVMRQGEISDELDGDDIREDRILAAALAARPASKGNTP